MILSSRSSPYVWHGLPPTQPATENESPRRQAVEATRRSISNEACSQFATAWNGGGSRCVAGSSRSRPCHTRKVLLPSACRLSQGTVNDSVDVLRPTPDEKRDGDLAALADDECFRGGADFRLGDTQAEGGRVVDRHAVPADDHVVGL